MLPKESLKETCSLSTGRHWVEVLTGKTWMIGEQTYLIQCVMAVSDAVDAIHETETDYDQSPDYEIRLLKALHRNSILQAATVGDPEEAKRHLRVAREAHNGLLALKGETSTPNSLWL